MSSGTNSIQNIAPQNTGKVDATTAQTTTPAKDETDTLKGCVKEFFRTLPPVAFLSAVGALSAYIFTAIPPIGGAILLGSFGTIALITILACRLLLNSSYEFAFIAGIVAGLFLVNIVAETTFPSLDTCCLLIQ